MAFILLLVLVGATDRQSDDSTQQLEYLSSSYRANKDSFVYGTFRFQFTRGSSASLKDAESEVFTKAFEESGFYAFDGENARYENVAVPKVLAAATTWTSELRSTAFITSFRSLTDGKLTLRDNHQTNQAGALLQHGVVISAGTKAFYKSGSFDFPMYLGDNGKGGSEYDLFRDLTHTKDGKLSLAELDMDSRLDGVKVCKFSYTWKEGKNTYWIDLGRGSLPIRILAHYNPNNTDVTYIFSDLAQAPNAGWLPRRRLMIIGKGEIVDRLVVTEIDTLNRPKPSTFELDFPEPITVYDSTKRLAYPARKAWSLLHLPSPSSKDVRPVIPYIPQPEMPAEVVATPPWIVVLVVVAALIVVLGSALVLVRRVRRPREA